MDKTSTQKDQKNSQGTRAELMKKLRMSRGSIKVSTEKMVKKLDAK